MIHHEEKADVFEKETWGKPCTSSAYLLFGLIKLDGDVPLETHIAGVIKHPETSNNDRVENSEAHADNSVLGELR